MNIKQIEKTIINTLTESGIELNEAKIEAKMLMKHFLGINDNDFIFDTEFSDFKIAKEKAKERAKTKAPIQHIIGFAHFMGEDFIVNKNVLIPRDETELLVKKAVEIGNKKREMKNGEIKILDIGTGSGCIAVSLKKYLPGAEVTAIDNSAEALELAQKNAEINHAEIVFKNLDMLNEQQWKDIGDFDIIVSNPPYVLESEKALMQPNVLEYEPSTALFVPDSNPLMYYDAIFRFAVSKKKRSQIYLEINENKASELMALAKKYEMFEIRIIKDINGKDRFLSGWRA